MTSIDDVLQLSQVYGHEVCDAGVILVEFVFSIVWQLLEASLDDEGLLEHAPETKSRWLTSACDMNINGPDNFSGKKTEPKEGLQRANTTMAVEIIGEFLQNKMTSRILSLVHQNMQELNTDILLHMVRFYKNHIVKGTDMNKLALFVGQHIGELSFTNFSCL